MAGGSVEDPFQCAQMEPHWNHFHLYGASLREGVGENGHGADVWGVKADEAKAKEQVILRQKAQRGIAVEA